MTSIRYNTNKKPFKNRLFRFSFSKRSINWLLIGSSLEYRRQKIIGKRIKKTSIIGINILSKFKPKTTDNNATIEKIEKHTHKDNTKHPIQTGDESLFFL